MRSPGEPLWFEHRHVVPLTGREPVLGRLMTRLQRRGPGRGWLTLQGPAGSGGSRLLREVALRIAASGAPAPLIVHPVPGSRLLLEPLRRVMRPLLPGRDVLAVHRSVEALLPVDPADQRALAGWLCATGSVREARQLDPRLVARLLGRVCTSGPVLVDEVADLDTDTLAVLRACLPAGGPDVIATTSTVGWSQDDGPCWDIEPLGESQVELLLRRWLRHSATARRLAGALSGPCQGWPGRIVGAVRELGRSGCLVKERRGVVFARVPAKWPDGLRRAGTFHEHIRRADEQTRRVFDLAALEGAPSSAAFLACAAGTSEAFVHGLMGEAAAARGGRASGFLFANRAARTRYAERLATHRRNDAIGRLQAKQSVRRDCGLEQDCADLLSLRVLVHAGEHQQAIVLLAGLLDARSGAHGSLSDGVEPWACDLLADIANELIESPAASHVDTLARSAHVLWRAGRHTQAKTLLRRLELSGTAPTAAIVLARARLASEADLRPELEQATATLVGAAGPNAFSAWALLAQRRLQADEVPAARAAWRAAAKTWLRDATPLEASAQRARWHAGLADCARARGRFRLAAAHLRRAIRLQRAASDPGALAALLQALGTCELRSGRDARSLAPLARAARLHARQGDASQAARVRHRMGRILLGQSAYDRAVEELRSALRMAHPDSDAGLRLRLHLALADAFRGCGNLDAERHHGQQAVKHADTELARLRGAAVVARSDLATGLPGAAETLTRHERSLREAGCIADADQARVVLFQAHLSSSETERAQALLPVGPALPMRSYAAARLDLQEGRHDTACAVFRALGNNPALPADLRAACHVHLAEGLHLTGRHPAAREAAVAAASLMKVRRRSRADDGRLHHVLAHVFGGVGEAARAEGHRSAARRTLRAQTDLIARRQAG